MERKDILKRALDIAVKYGMENPHYIRYFTSILNKNTNKIQHFSINDRHYYEIIFSHEFAEAFALHIKRNKLEAFLGMMSTNTTIEQIKFRLLTELVKVYDPLEYLYFFVKE